jgi:hypothetical protein
MPPQNYGRDKNGVRFDLIGGMTTMMPADLIQQGQGFPYLQNVRRNLAGRTVSRPTLSGNFLTGTILPPTSMILMDDPYMVTPPAFGPTTYVLILGASGFLYVNTTQLVSGLTGLPLSFIIFGPNTTPQPWCYVADGSMAITIPNYPATIYGNPIAGMVKVRSDKTVYKTGIAEPQVAPNVTLTQGAGPNWTIYRYVYRSSVTGAISNPSPESGALVAEQGTDIGGPVNATATGVTYNASQYEPNPEDADQLRTSGNVGGGVLTDFIIVTGFGLNIPENVPIQGVTVSMNWYGQNAGAGLLFNVSLYYQGNQFGTPKSPGISNTGPDDTTATTTQGSNIDSWGATLSPGVVNDPTFGFGVQIEAVVADSTNRSFINSFTITVYYADQNAVVTATSSPDPQVDKIDFYRSDPGLDDFTYVGTILNSGAAAGLSDTLSDLAVAANPTLEFDNYEPFPSIDLPRSGICDVTQVIQFVSGVQISSPGSGQINGDYTIPSTGGGGTGATVHITITGGAITTAVVATAGQDYTSAPTFLVPTTTGTTGTLVASISPVDPGAPNVTQRSGDLFNVRWLPGDILLLGGYPGSTQQIAWTLYARPISPTQLQVYQSIIDPTTGIPSFNFPAAGTGLTFEISAATLAAQPSPVIWGPTPENQGSFYFGVDPLNPGDLVWSKGNNFDSAPDTNRMIVTSPSEMLMNGTITSELSTVFSTERFWLIYPNFANAIATVTGTTGPQWTLTQAQAKRGLYMRYAIFALGSMIAYRAKDCIAVSMGGGPEESITDAIYNLFPHGGAVPQPVVIAGITVYPPDDTKPAAQTITMTPSYLFYNYQDTTGTPRTLVYDLEAKGWSVDVYTPTVNCHLSTVAGSNARLLTGCSDGTVRVIGEGLPSTETGTSILLTRAENGGDARALKRIGDIFFKAELFSSAPVSLQFWESQFVRQIASGFAPTTLTGTTGIVTYYTVDFTSGLAFDVDNIGAVLSWPLGSNNILDLWQPSWTELPEVTQDRPSDWDDGGTSGNKYVQGLLLECDTFGFSKTFQVESDDGVMHTPVPMPFTQNGQAIRSFTFNPPFTAHMIRIVSTDGVAWRFAPSGGWSASWITQPYPESSSSWTTQMSSLGLLGWNHIYQINLAYISATPITLTVSTDQGPFTLTYPPSTGNVPSKILLKCPRNKWKVVSFTATSTAAFSLWKDLTEVWVKSWGSTSEYQKVNPFGGDSSPAAPI